MTEKSFDYSFVLCSTYNMTVGGWTSLIFPTDHHRVARQHGPPLGPRCGKNARLSDEPQEERARTRTASNPVSFWSVVEKCRHSFTKSNSNATDFLHYFSPNHKGQKDYFYPGFQRKLIQNCETWLRVTCTCVQLTINVKKNESTIHASLEHAWVWLDLELKQKISKWIFKFAVSNNGEQTKIKLLHFLHFVVLSLSPPPLPPCSLHSCSVSCAARIVFFSKSHVANRMSTHKQTLSRKHRYFSRASGSWVLPGNATQLLLGFCRYCLLSRNLALPLSSSFFLFFSLRHAFLSASPDNIKQWQFPDGKFLHNFSGHNAIVNAITINEENVVVSGGKRFSFFSSFPSKFISWLFFPYRWQWLFAFLGLEIRLQFPADANTNPTRFYRLRRRHLRAVLRPVRIATSNGRSGQNGESV